MKESNLTLSKEKVLFILFGLINSEKAIRLRRIPGKGLILLLHGAPGVGKTSTAGMCYEAVLEAEDC